MTFAQSSTIAPLSVTDLAALVSRVAADSAAWQPRIRFNPEARWWTRLSGDDVVDVWLLTWVTDTNTDLHDHGESAGAFTVVAGELEEVRLAADPQALTTTRVGVGQVCRIDRGVVHDVRSPTAHAAVSIHAYSPPLREMTFYESHPAGPTPVRTVNTRDTGAAA